MRSSIGSVRGTGVCALTLASLSGPVAADAPPVALEEIVVTAQKREEMLQEVPLSITAITTEELKTRGIENVNDLSAAAPNLFSRPNPGANDIATIGIRGSVSGQPAIWADSPIGVYLDGVYLGKAQGSVMDVVDLERVEVLRGPQGTLFGRNTEGGAINFVTRQPTGNFDGNAEVDYGNYNHRIGRLSLDLPRWGILSVSLAARNEKMDGWATNRSHEGDPGAVDKDAFRVAAKADILDSLDLTYAFDYSNQDNVPTVTSLYSLQGSAGTFNTVLAPPLNAFFLQTLHIPGVGDAIANGINSALLPYVRTSRPSAVDTPPDLALWERSNNKSHMAVLDWQATDTEEFKYIFARRTMYYSDQQSISGAPLTGISVVVPTHFPPPYPATITIPWGMAAVYNRKTNYEQTSNELQWLGNHDKLHYVVGLYDFEDNGETKDPQDFSLFGQAPFNTNPRVETDARAAYAQAEYEFLDRWTVTAGIRYTKESRSGSTHAWLTNGYKGSYITDGSEGTPAALTCLSRNKCLPYTHYSADFTGTTPMGALAFKYSDDLNFYARVARGFKSGGFSSELLVGPPTEPNVTTPYKPEFSTAYEVGAKSTLWDGRATLNAALFYTKLTDLQGSRLVPGTSQAIIVNSGEGTRKGFEIEGRVRIADGWIGSLGYGYLKSNSTGTPVTGPTGATSDTTPGYAPDNTLNLGLDGRLWQLEDGSALRLIVDYIYLSKYYLYACNKSTGGGTCDDVMPSTGVANARLLLGDVSAGPGKVDLSLFVKNLTNSGKPIQGIDFSMFVTANWMDPRTWLLTAAYKW